MSDKAHCIPCSKCDAGIVLEECNATHDTICQRANITHSIYASKPATTGINTPFYLQERLISRLSVLIFSRFEAENVLKALLSYTRYKCKLGYKLICSRSCIMQYENNIANVKRISF